MAVPPRNRLGAGGHDSSANLDSIREATEVPFSANQDCSVFSMT